MNIHCGLGSGAADVKVTATNTKRIAAIMYYNTKQENFIISDTLSSLSTEQKSHCCEFFF